MSPSKLFTILHNKYSRIFYAVYFAKIFTPLGSAQGAIKRGIKKVESRPRDVPRAALYLLIIARWVPDFQKKMTREGNFVENAESVIFHQKVLTGGRKNSIL